MIHDAQDPLESGIPYPVVHRRGSVEEDEGDGVERQAGARFGRSRHNTFDHQRDTSCYCQQRTYAVGNGIGNLFARCLGSPSNISCHNGLLPAFKSVTSNIEYYYMTFAAVCQAVYMNYFLILRIALCVQGDYTDEKA